MIAYASRTGTRRNIALLKAAGWRWMISPKGRMGLNLEGMGYALDNGAWTCFMNGEPFDEPAFCLALDRFGENADWIVIPDIVAAGAASIEFSDQWLPRLRAGGFNRLMLAVQNGMESHHALPYLRQGIGIFVGGDTDWKLATLGHWAALAHEHGQTCHAVRVNTARRIRLCAAAAVDSFDGSGPSRFADELPRLDIARRQPDLYAGART